jgi:hypothetical protein
LLAEVPKLLEKRFISAEAGDYLLRYARNELALPCRPAFYRFLDHRWNRASHPTPQLAVTYDEEAPLRGVTVSIRDVEGHATDPSLAIEDGVDTSEVRLNTTLS